MPMNEQESQQVEHIVNPAPEATEQAAPQSSWAEDTFTVGGKEIKGTRDEILKWAAMGHSYPQKAQEWNNKVKSYELQKSEWEKAQELQQKYKPYEEIDQYAAQNQDWWNHVNEQYKSKISTAQTQPEVAQLKAELADIKKYIDDSKSEKKSQEKQVEDSELSKEIESIQKSYPNLDFATPNDDGKSLEMLVLEHADKIGAKSFRAAFRDYYFDHLVGKAKDEGKETAVKERQKLTKLGILSESQVPTKGLQVAQNTRNKSYNELAREALSELNIS